MFHCNDYYFPLNLLFVIFVYGIIRDIYGYHY